MVQAVDNTTKIRGANLPIGGLSAHHHCLCAFHKITQTLRKLMARNRCSRHQRAVGYTILAKTHDVLRTSETEEELNDRLSALHRNIQGNYILPDSRYLEANPLKVSKPKKLSKNKPSKQRKVKTKKPKQSAPSDVAVGVAKLDEASAALPQNLQVPMHEIQKFCGYDEGNQEIQLIWEGTAGEQDQQCAYQLHCDLGEVVFGRLCEDAGIDLSIVKRTSGIAAASGAPAGVAVR